MSSNYKRPGVNSQERSDWNSAYTTINNVSGDITTNTNNIAYLSAAIDSENLWDLDGTTLQPSTATNTLTLPYLSGTNNTIVITNSAGLLQNTTATINAGVTGGSIIGVTEFSTDPLSDNLITGDIWITDNIATSGKLLKYWDGAYKYSVELSRE